MNTISLIIQLPTPGLFSAYVDEATVSRVVRLVVI